MKKKIAILFSIILFIFIIAIIIFKINSTTYIGPAGINIEEFNNIQIGKTTMFGISKIIDSTDEWDNDEIYDKVVTEIESSKEDKNYTHVYKYLGENGGYAVVTFEADYSNGSLYNDFIVTKKENFGIK